MPGDRLTPMLPPLVGGILIGGASRRMGRPKALLEWEGVTFLERIAAALQAVVPEIVLLGADARAAVRGRSPSGRGGPARAASHGGVAGPAGSATRTVGGVRLPAAAPPG